MLSTYGANLLVGIITGQDTMPASLWLALLTQHPTVDQDGTDIAAYEPTSTGYERKQVTLDGLTSWTAPATKASSYTVEISYSPVVDFPEVTSWALVTSSTAGMVFFYDYLPTPYTFLAGSLVTVPVNTLILKAD